MLYPTLRNCFTRSSTPSPRLSQREHTDNVIDNATTKEALRADLKAKDTKLEAARETIKLLETNLHMQNLRLLNCPTTSMLRKVNFLVKLLILNNV